MADRNCRACDELKVDAPNLIVNGITGTECASLANNTGLNPSSGNDDCTDLDNMNDCLIGNMEAEADAYDVCEWKPFMKRFIPNVWTTIKAIICAICGLWTNIASLKSRLDAMCALVDALVNPPASRFGTLLNSEGTSHPERRGGTIGVKDSKPVVVPMAQSDLDTPTWNAQNVGIYLGKQQISKCSDGTCQNYEWIAPSIIGYKVTPDLELAAGDIVWCATKAECTAWGMSENMWNAFTISSWIWTDYVFAGDSKSNAWFRLHVNNNRLEMTYEGYVGDSQTNTGKMIIEGTEPLKRYGFGC